MPEQSVDTLLVIALAVYVMWQIYTMIRAKGKIELEGRVFGKPVAVALFAALIAFAAWSRRDSLEALWIVIALLVINCVLFMMVKAGFGNNGVYINGKYIPYAKMKGYSINRETEKGFTIRMATKSKEYALDFTPDSKNIVLAYMSSANIPDFEKLRGKKNG